MFAAQSDVITDAHSCIYKFKVFYKIPFNILAMFSPVCDGSSKGMAPKLKVYIVKFGATRCNVALIYASPFLDDQISVVKLGLIP